MARRPVRSWLALCAAALGCLLGLARPGAAWAVEAITGWHSDVTVNADGTLEVRETLRVNAEGESISHGIERDFPLRFTDWRGNLRLTRFDVREVTLDGQAAHYELIPVADGVRLRIGDAAQELARGAHEFVLAYSTQHQLYEVDGQGVLYWNVTGNAWELPIDSASCTVRLSRPLQAGESRLEAFTGLAGSTAGNATAALEEGVARYATTAALPAGWGLTVVLHFPRELARLDDAGATQPAVNGIAPLGGKPAAGAPKWLVESWPVLVLLLVLVANGLRRGGGGGPDSGYRTYRNAGHRSPGRSGGGFSGRSGGGGGGGGGRGW